MILVESNGLQRGVNRAQQERDEHDSGRSNNLTPQLPASDNRGVGSLAAEPGDDLRYDKTGIRYSLSQTSPIFFTRRRLAAPRLR